MYVPIHMQMPGIPYAPWIQLCMHVFLLVQRCVHIRIRIDIGLSISYMKLKPMSLNPWASVGLGTVWGEGGTVWSDQGTAWSDWERVWSDRKTVWTEGGKN